MKKIAPSAAKAFGVTSFEEGRVVLVKRGGDLFVSKRTTKRELNNLIRAKKWLKTNGNLSGRKTGLCLRVTAPEVVEWRDSDGILVMEYCDGVNLEIELMKNDKNRDFYIDIISDLLCWMRNGSFYWQGFAPRNILFNKKNNTVTLIDFESGLKIGKGMMSEKDFNLFIQNRVMLELATVLFADEQHDLCPNVWKYSKRTSISLEKVDGRRRRGYILFHHPGAHKIKHKDLVRIEKSIVSIATPFYCKSKVFYPLIALAKIKSIDIYIKTVVELEAAEKLSWPRIISNAIGSNKRP